MAKPFIHAESSVRKWGGTVEDYLLIHDLIDKSKGAIADSRHRTLTHNSWFLSEILELIFGHNITTSTGRDVSVRDIGEQHVMEDFANRFIPSPQDFLEHMEMKDWMINGKGEGPSSIRKIEQLRKTSTRSFPLDFTID